jgi:hypothetical protein
LFASRESALEKTGLSLILGGGDGTDWDLADWVHAGFVTTP